MKNKNLILFYWIAQSIILILVMNSGCSEEIITGNPIEQFTLTTDQDILTIEAGASADIQVTGTLTTSGSYFKVEIGSTNLTGASLSGCDSVKFDSTNSGICTLTIFVPSGTMPGDYDIDLHGRAYFGGTNILDSKFISINVPGPDFSIVFETDSITVKQGQSDTVAINITRFNNNTEGIDFTVSTPSGLSGTFSQQFNVIGNTTNFIVTADQAITPGNYNVIVNGTGSTTLISRDATLSVSADTLISLWFIVTPDPAPPYLYDIDGNYAVGQNGTILRTMDEGLNWEYLTSGTSSHLRSVFDAGGTIYVAGDNGTVLKGSGSSWQNIGIPQAISIEDIHKIDGHLWAVGSIGTSAAAFRSTDEGQSWILSSTPFGPYDDILSASFSDTSNGILVGNLHRTIFRTTNAGEMWQAVTVEPLQLNYISGNIACGTNGYIIQTTDGGSTWQNITSFIFDNLHSFSGVIYVGEATTIIRNESGNYISEETGISNFSADLFGVTLNGTYIAVGGGLGGVGVIIKRQPL